jgi:hypothetical protein
MPVLLKSTSMCPNRSCTAVIVSATAWSSEMPSWWKTADRSASASSRSMAPPWSPFQSSNAIDAPSSLKPSRCGGRLAAGRAGDDSDLAA